MAAGDVDGLAAPDGRARAAGRSRCVGRRFREPADGAAHRSGQRGAGARRLDAVDPAPGAGAVCAGAYRRSVGTEYGRSARRGIDADAAGQARRSTLDRGAAVRQPEPRSRRCLFRRRPGRGTAQRIGPHRRSEGHFAQFVVRLSRDHGRRARNRRAARCGPSAAGVGPAPGRRGAHHCAADRCVR